jgi:hypothetical protein
MVLHEFRDDLVLLSELGLEPLNKLGLKSLLTGWPPSGAVQRTLGLVEHLLDPGVNLAWLEAELIGEIGNRFLTAEVAANDLSLLRHGEMPTGASHGTYLRLGT